MLSTYASMWGYSAPGMIGNFQPAYVLGGDGENYIAANKAAERYERTINSGVSYNKVSFGLLLANYLQHRPN